MSDRSSEAGRLHEALSLDDDARMQEALERIVVSCDSGSKAHDKIAFIRRVAAAALSRKDRPS